MEKDNIDLFILICYYSWKKYKVDSEFNRNLSLEFLSLLNKIYSKGTLLHISFDDFITIINNIDNLLNKQMKNIEYLE